MTKNVRAWAIIAGLAFLAYSSVLESLSDRIFRPWVFADPPLFASWIGPLTTGNGVRLILGMELRRAVGSRDRQPCARCNQIEGVATTCDARGTLRHYRVQGTPSDRHGTRMLLGAVPATDPPPDGLELDTVQGDWDGADTLTMQADFFWRRGTSAVSSTDDPANQPVPLRMTRAAATEFDVRCRALRRGV